MAADAFSVEVEQLSLGLRPDQTGTVYTVESVFCWVAAVPDFIVAPTGNGKSVTLAALARSVVDRGARVIVLSHLAELASQAAPCACVAGECKRRSNNPSLKRPDNLVAPE